MKKGALEVVHRVQITGNLKRHDVEELYLEIRRLAKRHGVQIKKFQREDDGRDQQPRRVDA